MATYTADVDWKLADGEDFPKALIAFAVDTGYSASLAERGQHEHSGI
jgi:hypothetical protein